MLSTRNLFLVIFIILSILSKTKCQICKKRVNLQRWVPESFYRTVIETYRGHCFFRCTKTRINTYYDERVVLKTTVEYRDECCPGYIEDHLKSILEGSVQCKPICTPACDQGFCKSPGVCDCYKGYELHQTDGHKCLPICKNGCEHGSCVGPDTCQCNFGYQLIINSCQPICTDPCINATCVAPDTCECLPGYRKTDSNLCFPYCSEGCTNGVCVSPENCVCNEGWVKDQLNMCTPYCEIACGGGICSRPNVCECFSGYILSDNGTCIPHCPQGCPHGQCVLPSNCSCENGWFKNQTDSECYPICNNDCQNGKCVEPNKCECNSNYTMLENGSCTAYCSRGCRNGVCLSPEVCECNAGWQKNELGICEAHCNSCNNGTCVEPNVCECLPGFKLKVDNDLESMTSLCVPECIGCNGTCLAPKHCACEIPFEAVAVTDDGQTCDCNESCSADRKQCHHTACVFKDTYYTSSTDITFTSDEDEYDVINTKYLEVSDDSSATDNYSDDMNSTSSYNTDAFRKKYKNEGISLWIYVSSITIVLVLLSIAICKHKVILHYCKSSSYVVEDDTT